MNATNHQRVLDIIDILKNIYPNVSCTLNADNAYQLLVAVSLSAQCTDKRVDMVTPALFARFPTPTEMAKADIVEVEEFIRTCGLYKTKAKNLVGMAKKLVSDYEGIVPGSIEELTTLPGVGRKTANLICGDIFGMPGAVVADTHCIRISNRLGLCDSTDPRKVEVTLRSILPAEESCDFCHRMVRFGRDICIARNPKCNHCPLSSLCPSCNAV